MRDRSLLSDKDFFRKTTNIVEQVRDCKIFITYWRGSNHIIDQNLNKSGKPKGVKFELNVATPSQKGIEKFTALNHELGHVLMQTPMYEATELLKRWLKDDEGDWLDADYGARKWNVFWSVMNILEDQRIESMMSKIWLANAGRFDKAKRNLGKTHKKCLQNPVDILLNIRFFREDLVKKYKESSEYKRALEDVVSTGRMGALIVLARLKPLIDEHFENKRKKEKSKKSSNETITKSLNNVHLPESGDGSDQKLSADESQSGNVEDQETLEDILDATDTEDSGIDETDEALGGLLDDEKEKANKEISDIKDIMSGDGTDGGERVPSYVKRVNRDVAPYKVDQKVSKKLQKLFRKISEIPKPTIGYEGEEIDIETYIENKANGSDITKCFIDEKYVNGASVMISIDGSGSMMSSYKIDDARDLVATLYDSVKDYPNITIKANVWSSNKMGDVGITDINSIEECNKITTGNDGGCYMTPTHLAIDYSSKLLKQMKGRRKILFVITDGLPQYSNNMFALKKNTLLILNKKAMLKARRSTPNMYVLLLGHSYNADIFMKDAFGKRVLDMGSMRYASDRIIKEFKRLVISTLR